MRSLAVLPLAALLLAACSADPPRFTPPDGAADAALDGAPRTDAPDAVAPLDLPRPDSAADTGADQVSPDVQEGGPRRCTRTSDCPAAPNWLCVTEGGESTCRCTPRPIAGDACEGLDNDCDGAADPNLRRCDGSCANTDLDRRNCGRCGASCGAAQVCEGGACRTVTGCEDRDGDGAGIGMSCRAMDCDDTNPRRYVGAPELCNGLDENCDGVADATPTERGGLTFETAAGMGCVAAFPPPSNELLQPVRCVLPTFDGASWVCRERPSVSICVMCVRGETGCRFTRNTMDGIESSGTCRQ